MFNPRIAAGALSSLSVLKNQVQSRKNIGFYLLIVALVLLLEMIGRPQESLFHNQPGAQNCEKETLAAELKSR